MKKFLVAFVLSFIISSPTFACDKDEDYHSALNEWAKFEMEEALKLYNEVISKNPNCPLCMKEPYQDGIFILEHKIDTIGKNDE